MDLLSAALTESGLDDYFGGGEAQNPAAGQATASKGNGCFVQNTDTGGGNYNIFRPVRRTSAKKSLPVQ